MRISSKSFLSGGALPDAYTGDQDDRSPELQWEDVPKETKSFALICEDVDEVGPQPWVHWLIYNIRPGTREILEGIPRTSEPGYPGSALQGWNSWNTIGYRGPVSSPDDRPHRCEFRLYALDCKLPPIPGLSRNGLLEAMDTHILAEAEIVGTYERCPYALDDSKASWESTQTISFEMG